MIGLVFIDNVLGGAAPFLVVLGAIGGFLIVPMNALLQHRGHNLMGAGPLDRCAELQRAGLHPGPGRLLRGHDAASACRPSAPSPSSALMVAGAM
jgi:hypothetical protein